jgi:hypothetical protein
VFHRPISTNPSRASSRRRLRASRA